MAVQIPTNPKRPSGGGGQGKKRKASAVYKRVNEHCDALFNAVIRRLKGA
jgi:hypothetical protein